MENLDKEKKKNNEHIEWYLFIGCMFIGMGIGEAFNNAGVGTMVGID